MFSQNQRLFFLRVKLYRSPSFIDLWCLSLGEHFGLITVKSSLNPMATQNEANLKNFSDVSKSSFSVILIKNYSPKAKVILFNNINWACFSIFTRSDLNRSRKETIKKWLVWLTGEFMHKHEAVNSGCAKVRSLQYLQTWQMIVLIFLHRVL